MAISCTAADLAAASKCLCGIASPADRQRVMIYLLQHIAGLDNLTPAELVARAKCLCGIPENRLKAVEVALLCAATGGVPPCPPCPPGGNCTYQDMQVAWTPTSEKLGEELGFFSNGPLPSPRFLIFNQATSLSGWDLDGRNIKGLSFPNLVSIDPLDTQGGFFTLTRGDFTSFSMPLLTFVAGRFVVRGSPTITSISLPSLQSVGTSGFGAANLDLGGLLCTSISLPSLVTIGDALNIDGDTSLVSVSLPSLSTIGAVNLTSVSAPGSTSLSSWDAPLWVPTPGTLIDFTGDALTATSIDQILRRCALNAAFTTGDLELAGGTNAAPTSTAPGSDYAILVGRGVTVNVNP